MFTPISKMPLAEEPNDAADQALCCRLIQQYVDLQRIKAAPDRDKEINYQIRVVKEKLRDFNVDIDQLELE